mgnify:CR=1 FL=1
MSDILTIELQIEPARQGQYFTVPFQVPEGVEALTLRYRYARRAATGQALTRGRFAARPERNIVDLGLIAPDGSQVGASGSDKTEIRVSATEATPGYRTTAIVPGEWQILVGAYKVADEGVQVSYEIVLERKHRRLFRGDLHTHTLASDGVHTAEELALKARRNGLDFVAVTDHNQPVAAIALPRVEGVTLIPGIEWTHYQGHANFLGVDQAYDGPFATNTVDEALAHFESARERGALISVNHPFDEGCPFLFDLQVLPFDCIEVWNGPMRESNLRAVGFWHQQLCAGQKRPAVGGSDYHRDTPFIFLGGPTMGVYAESRGAADLLAAIRAGHAFITFAPNGPSLQLNAGPALMGDSVRWPEVQAVRVVAEDLLAGDVVRVVTASRAEVLFQAPSDGDVALDYALDAPGFVRIEILRAFLPGLPLLPALLSNPIYFDAAGG